MTTLPIVTTSERRAFKRCPQRWWWSFREGLAPTILSEKLWFGIGIHEALAHLYGPGKKRRKDYIDKWHAFCDEDDMSMAIRTYNDADEAHWVEARLLGATMLEGYVERWNWDRDWDVVYTEEPFAIEIPDPSDINGPSICVFNSTFDGVYRDKAGNCWLMEHKTAAGIRTGHLNMDDQAGVYWAVATQVLRDKGILGKRERIIGIMYNFLLKRMPDDRPRDAEGYCLNAPLKSQYVDALAAKGIPTKGLLVVDLAALAEEHGLTIIGERSKNQPPPLFERQPVRRTAKERTKQILNVGNEVAAMNFHRETGGKLLYKNPTVDCSWDCQFREMCELHEQDADWEEFRDARFVVRDPYDRYRLRKSAADVI